MNFIQTNRPGTIRDPYSKAIHFVDDQARNDFLEKQELQNEINIMKKSIEDLHSVVSHDISEIKHMISSVISSKGNR